MDARSRCVDDVPLRVQDAAKLRPIIRRNRLKKFFERGTELFLNGAQRLHDGTALFVLHFAQTWESALALSNGKKSFLSSASTKYSVGFPKPD